MDRGPTVRGPKELWRSTTRPNSLLVSVAAHLNSEAFLPVIAWFQNLNVLPVEDLEYSDTVAGVSKDDHLKQRVLDLLRDADINVADLTTRRDAIPLKELQPYLPPSRLEEFSRSGRSSLDFVSASLLHPVAGRSDHEALSLEEESDGTQRLFSLAGPWLDLLDNGRVAVVDELDRSLHPLLVAELVRRVNSEGMSGTQKRAQLIATVHDVTLLGNVVSRGQVWFTDKDRTTEAARLTPLSDYHPRRKEALAQGYLGGRYGGVPVVTEPAPVG